MSLQNKNLTQMDLIERGLYIPNHDEILMEQSKIMSYIKVNLNSLYQLQLLN